MDETLVIAIAGVAALLLINGNASAAPAAFNAAQVPTGYGNFLAPSLSGQATPFYGNYTTPATQSNGQMNFASGLLNAAAPRLGGLIKTGLTSAAASTATGAIADAAATGAIEAVTASDAAASAAAAAAADAANVAAIESAGSAVVADATAGEAIAATAEAAGFWDTVISYASWLAF